MQVSMVRKDSKRWKPKLPTKKDKLFNHLIQARRGIEHSILPVTKVWNANLIATPPKNAIFIHWAQFKR